MREIKFRAWNGKSMEYGGFCLHASNGEICHLASGLTNVTIDSPKMQYTGLKDKNGKEIYEGDVVKCHKFTQELGDNLGVMEGEREFIAKIEFSVFGGTQAILPNGEFMFVWEFEEGWHEESLETIGNIYENPELLK